MNLRAVPTRLGNVAYEEHGAGPPLVLLHASGHSRHDFDAVVPALARHFRTIAIDWPGMGDSAAPESPSSVTASLFADVLEDVVRELALPAAVFLGNSVGGFASARFAARHPDRVRGLVLVNSGGFTPSNPLTRALCWLKGREWVTRLIERRFAGYYLKGRNVHARAVLRQVEASRRKPDTVSVIAALWRSFALSSSDVSTEAKAIRCPTLLVWGERDPVLQAKVEGRRARDSIPGARYVELATGHSPFVEEPEAFLAAALPFFAEVG